MRPSRDRRPRRSPRAGRAWRAVRSVDRPEPDAQCLRISGYQSYESGSTSVQLPMPDVEGADVTRTARAFWLREPGSGEIRTADVPDPGPGEVLVRTLFSGVSR